MATQKFASKNGDVKYVCSPLDLGATAAPEFRPVRPGESAKFVGFFHVDAVEWHNRAERGLCSFTGNNVAVFRPTNELGAEWHSLKTVKP